ncbi:MAG: hypothetical protein HZA37_01720 [Parcubacteria group bacterium]|nr:hypothetical protein [Parcubacteria group bacterium]
MIFNRKKIFIIILRNFLKALFAAAAAFAVAFFLGEQIVKSGNSVVEQQTLLFILEKRTDVLSQMRRDFEIIGNADETINQAVPSAENILNFVAALESLGVRSGVSQSFRFGTPTPIPGDFQEIGYDLSVAASLPAMIAYFENFEKLPYFTDIAGFSVSSVGGVESAGTAQIKSKVYVR